MTSGPPGNGRQLAIPSSASSRTLGDHSLPGCGCSDKAALYAAGTPLRCGRGGLAPGEEQQDLGWTIQPPSLEDLSVSEGRAWSPEDGVTVEPHPHSLQKSWMTWNFGESQVSLGMMDGTAHEGSPPRGQPSGGIISSKHRPTGPSGCGHTSVLCPPASANSLGPGHKPTWGGACPSRPPRSVRPSCDASDLETPSDPQVRDKPHGVPEGTGLRVSVTAATEAETSASRVLQRKTMTALVRGAISASPRQLHTFPSGEENHPRGCFRACSAAQWGSPGS